MLKTEPLNQAARRDGSRRATAFISAEYLFPVALEGALKLKEISYIHAEGYPTAEMKHGPIALIDETPRVFVARAVRASLSNIEEVRAADR